MSGRKNSLKWQAITNAAMTADVIGSVTNIENLDNIGIQFNFTGTPTGTFQVQVSADYAQNPQGVVTNVGNWINMNLGSTPTASGAADNIYLDLFGLSSFWIRPKYTFTSGTGTLNCYLVAKMT